MMREILPDAKTLGIMYTTSEANSVSAIEDTKLWQEIMDLNW